MTMNRPECFPDPLSLDFHKVQDGSTIFRITHRYRVITSAGTVTVPEGFLTDGASVPRFFWNILQPFGEYFPAALLHDFLYSKGGAVYPFSRRQVDVLFLEAMYNIGVGWATRHTIYTAVRLFGRKPWKKRSGEKD